MRWFFGVLLLAGLATGGWWYWRGWDGQTAANQMKFRTAKVERGLVVEGVQASGTVQPLVLVQVGTQISGVIEKILVDFNTHVKEGDTLALLDRRRLQSQVRQDEAALARAQADVGRVKAQLVQADREREREKTLVERKLVAQADLDAAVATADSLQAQLEVALAAVQQSEAQLQGDRVNLEYATIVSPVEGVVVSRNIDVGQTVAASLSAPTLFVIANDLTKIQVQASVPEADIGRIHEHQRVTFSVDAHPDRAFDGEVSQIRLASTTVQNVVTYTVMVDASNPEGLLLPGMTANATFEVARSAADALRVPASALRLQPAPELVEKGSAAAAGGGEGAEGGGPGRGDEAPRDPAAGRPAPGGGPNGAAGPRPGRGEGEARDPAAGRPPGGSPGGRPRERGTGGGGWGAGGQRKKDFGSVYVRGEGGLLRRVSVRVKTSDGTLTAIEPRDPASVQEGTEVVTAILRQDEEAAKNPFMPTMPGGRRR